MKKIILAFLAILWVSAPCAAQHALRLLVQDAETQEPLAGVYAVVETRSMGAVSFSNGLLILQDLPAGLHTVRISFVGYRTVRHDFPLPMEDSSSITPVLLTPLRVPLDGITVSTTRASRTIADIPTRVEVIGTEEIQEKMTMKQSNISMLLNESPGIHIQQTSPVSGIASIRMFGLDGRYVQVLRDGFPMYGGLSGGLSIMQIPPSDLYQVEIIKGPSSTLYGGDAIAGIINLITKTPEEEPEWTILMNRTTQGGTDFSTFISRRDTRSGYTGLATANLQQAYDASGDGYSNVPEIRSFNLAQRSFLYLPLGELTVGITATLEDRKGGAMNVIDQDHFEHAEGYFEHNSSGRMGSQMRFETMLGESLRLVARNSLLGFQRTITRHRYRFRGVQAASFSEVSLQQRLGGHDMIAGLNITSDAFRELDDPEVPRSYSFATAGLFAQDTWDLTPRISLESGLRWDHHSRYGSFLLPRLHLLYRFSPRISARAGGGMGYRAPGLFLEPAERVAFRDVQPLAGDLRAERSSGMMIDLNYRTFLGERFSLSFNQAAHWMRVEHAIIPLLDPLQRLSLVNSNDLVVSRGLESNLKIGYDDFHLFGGYALTRATTERAAGSDPLPLIPEHKTWLVLMFEKDELGRLGYELFYTGPQPLDGNRRSAGYWVMGIMAERRIGPVSVFLNFENFMNVMQSRWETLVVPHATQPQFAPLWAPTEGRVINGGLRISL